MASFLDTAIKETGKGFDIERKLVMPLNSWVALLGRDSREKTFYQLRYYAKGFIPRTNNFRTGFYVEIATLDNLRSDILKCTHFVINGTCYALSDGDVFQPSGDRFSWMIYGTFVKDTYAPAV